MSREIRKHGGRRILIGEGVLGDVRAGRRTAQELRQAIDCLPVRTREAMLEGINDNDIIVGAYTDRDGRVCPMLACVANRIVPAPVARRFRLCPLGGRNRKA